MKTIVKKFNIYQYSELNEEAKEKVRIEYLENPIRKEGFINMIYEDLKNLFPSSELKVQWELSYSYRDGVNVYGNLDIMDLVNMIQNNLCGDTYLKFKDFFL